MRSNLKLLALAFLVSTSLVVGQKCQVEMASGWNTATSPSSLVDNYDTQKSGFNQANFDHETYISKIYYSVDDEQTVFKGTTATFSFMQVELNNGQKGQYHGYVPQSTQIQSKQLTINDRIASLIFYYNNKLPLYNGATTGNSVTRVEFRSDSNNLILGIGNQQSGDMRQEYTFEKPSDLLGLISKA